ncbi:TetR/AcrR family transcriptional regulator [Streptomyces natalensis]|uniref:TetR/AcrR family transcriptional regulator n=1 Tax=Streptomyces natalensis TaxID=68242 RepID=UPI000690F3C6|nr:TetR/AcrR family transcriptional regulator [Streptomyces natalensis]
MSANDGRERILRAALELIARDGFDGVRIADIARRAGASTALVHYHFSTRAQLLTASLAHSLSAAEARLERRTDSEHRSAPPERLADLIDFGLPLTHEDVMEWRLWSELEMRAAGSPELARTLASLNDRIIRPLAATVTAGLATGDFRDCDPDEVATVALALLTGLATRLIARDRALTLAHARHLAGRQLALAVGYAGELPFQTLPPQPAPAPGTENPSADAASPPRPSARRRAPRTSSRP